MITIYAANETDFSTLGLGALEPSELYIDEKAGGLYELKLVQPITDSMRHALLTQQRIIKAPAPVRESPYAEIAIEGSTTVEREIYKVITVGKRLRLHTKPALDGGKTLGYYPPGTEVAKLEDAGSQGDYTWFKVAILDGGAVGYMAATYQQYQYLQYVRTETETISGDTPGAVIRPTQARDQLFRIYSVQPDSKRNTVTVLAQHITYDLKGAIIKETYAPENTAANVICAQLLTKLDHGMPDFNLYCAVTAPISGDYTGRNLLECLLDSDIGIVAQTGARLVRDNYDIFILPDEERDLGMQIRYAKNLLDASMTTDVSGLITRIMPVGRTKDGEDLYITENGGFVDSDHINDYPDIYAKRVEYGVVESDDLSLADARAKLKAEAEADFAAGCDLPDVALDVDFVRLELTGAYQSIANSYALHLYDSASVVAEGAGIVASVRMSGYRYDGMRGEYSRTELGKITDADITVYGYEIAGGSIGGSKISPGAVGELQLKNGAVVARSIRTGAITANAIAAGVVTADKLDADTVDAKIASIADARIGQATIGTAQIGDAAIVSAKIADLNVTEAKIADLAVTTAKIAQAAITNAKIGDAAIDTAKIALGAITSALIQQGAIGTAQIADGSITDAKIVSLSANRITAGTLSVERLIIRGSDQSLIYAINNMGELVSTQVDTIDGYVLTERTITADKIVAHAITANEIAAKTITANEILAGTITGDEIAAATITGSNIKAGTITTSLVSSDFGQSLNLESNESVNVLVDSVQIGGRNLLLESGREVSNDAYLTAAYAFGDDPPRQGQRVTLRIWGQLGAGKAYWGVYNSGGSIGIGNTVDQGDGTYVMHGTWRNTGSSGAEITPTELRLYATPQSAAATSVIHRVKLEVGDKATDWTPAPEDAAPGVDTGAVGASGVRVRITSGEFEVDTPGTEGDFRLDRSGGTLQTLNSQTINCPEVAKVYAGPTTIHVGTAASTDGSAFLTLTEAANALNNKLLPGEINLYLDADLTETVTISNLTGGHLRIHGQGHTMTGILRLYYCQSVLELDRLKVAYSATNAACVNVKRCAYALFTSCIISNTYGSGSCGMLIWCGSNVTCEDTEFYGATQMLRVLAGSSLDTKNIKGGGGTYYLFAQRAKVIMYGTRPDGNGYIGENTIANPVSPNSLTVDTGSAAPTVKPTATITSACHTSATYDGTWRAGNVQQGRYDTVYYAGCMWFDLSAIAGKTVKNAVLTLKRLTGAGLSQAVSVCLNHTPATGAGGNPLTGRTDYGAIGTLAWNATGQLAIPAAAIQKMAGSGGGLMLYTASDPSTYGKAYGDNYALFGGAGSSQTPQLSVTYEI